MKDKKLIIIIAVLVLILIGMIVIAVVPFGNKNDSNNTNSTTKTEENLDLNIEYSTDEKDSNWKDEDYTDVVLTESLNITKAGTYHITGTIENGSITINVGDEDIVKLILDNVSVTNQNGSAIYVENADKVIITLADGTTNTITDGGTDERYHRLSERTGKGDHLHHYAGSSDC